MSDARRRSFARISGVVLVVGGLVLVAAGRAWGSGQRGYLVARTLDAPLLWLFVTAMGAVVLWAARTAVRGRTALDVLGWVLVPIVALALVRFTLLAGGPGDAKGYPSPDGSRALVVQPVSSILDPLWELRLESGDGLTKRYRIVDCVNGDWSDFERAQWLSPSRLKIVHGSEGGIEHATTVTLATSSNGTITTSGIGLDACSPGSPASTR